MPQAALRFLPQYAAGTTRGITDRFMRYASRCTLTVSTTLAVLGYSTYSIWRVWLEPNVAISIWYGLAFVPAIAMVHLYQESLRSYKRIVLSQSFEQLLIPLVLFTTAAVAIWQGIKLSSFMLLSLHITLYIGVGALLCVVVRRSIQHIGTAGESLAARAPSTLDRLENRQWRGVAIPLGISGVTSVILSRSDVLFVGAMMSSATVAYYSAAAKLAFVMNLGLWSLNAIATPYISEAYHKRDFANLQRIVTYVTWFAIAISLVPATMFWFGGNWILSLFGPQYTIAFPVLICLSLAHLFNVACGPVGPLMMTTGCHREYAYTMGIVCAINVIATPFAIVRYGMLGAAIVNLITTIAWDVALAYIVRRRHGIATYPCFPSISAK
jgi:O-antigen/teichoic acid export membrane protein